MSIENVRDNWSKVTDMQNAEHLDSIQEATGALITSLEKLRTTEKPSSNDDPDVFPLTDNAFILYSLAVGASVANPEEMKFLYENHEEFGPLPTFFILPGLQKLMTSRLESPNPKVNLSLEKLLHGEQYMEILGEIPHEGQLTSKIKLVDLLDKGSGAVFVYDGMF